MLAEDVDVLTELHGEQDEDVTITTAADGNAVQCSTQVHDYRFRAPALSHLSQHDGYRIRLAA